MRPQPASSAGLRLRMPERATVATMQYVHSDEFVQRLLDRVAIRELTARYNRSFDLHDPDAFASTFVRDGVVAIEGGPEFAGQQALAGMCAGTPPGLMHVTTDATVDVDGDEATQECSLLALKRPAGGGGTPLLMASGSYEDKLVRTENGWLFSRRLIRLDGATPTMAGSGDPET